MIIPCRLCGTNAHKTHVSTVLGKHEVAYFLCPDCDLLQTEQPHWLEEAYQNSISALDTGLMHRNKMVSGRVARFCFRHGLEKTNGVDFAGGYGILTRMLRDFGLSFFWMDKYSPNLAARGFEANREIQYEVVTAFEVLEHFDEPGLELAEILEVWAPGFLLFETTLRENRIVPGSEWKYYALESGQHVAFYSVCTLEFIAKKFTYHFWREGRLLVLSKRPRSGWLWSVLKLPFAWFKSSFPDAIPFIRRDQEEMRERLERAQFASEEKRAR